MVFDCYGNVLTESVLDSLKNGGGMMSAIFRTENLGQSVFGNSHVILRI